MDDVKIDYGDIVTLRDGERMIEWKCMVVEELDLLKFLDGSGGLKRRIYSNRLNDCEIGGVWVYSPLGSALYGKQVGACLTYYIMGVKFNCEVVKVIKSVKNYIC